MGNWRRRNGRGEERRRWMNQTNKRSRQQERDRPPPPPPPILSSFAKSFLSPPTAADATLAPPTFRLRPLLTRLPLLDSPIAHAPRIPPFAARGGGKEVRVGSHNSRVARPTSVDDDDGQMREVVQF